MPFIAREVGGRLVGLPEYPEVLVAVALISAVLTATLVVALAAWTQLGNRVWVPTLVATAILGIAHGTTYESRAFDALTIMRATALAMVGVWVATRAAKHTDTSIRPKSTLLQAVTAVLCVTVVAGAAFWCVAEQQMMAARSALEQARLNYPNFPWPHDSDHYRYPSSLLEVLCTVDLQDVYAQAVFEHCKQHGLGDRVGGGCWHIRFRAWPPEWLRSRACFAQ